MNSFAALQDSSESEDNVSDVEIPQPAKKTHHKHKPTVKSFPQSGGSFAERRDPLTGVGMGNSTHNPLEFDSEDLDVCLRVINAVGANMSLFKLPQLKPLRAAIHPLVVEQMKNYDVTSQNERGNERATRRNRNKKRKGGADVYEDLQKLQKQKLASLEEEYINQVTKLTE